MIWKLLAAGAVVWATAYMAKALVGERHREAAVLQAQRGVAEGKWPRRHKPY